MWSDSGPQEHYTNANESLFSPDTALCPVLTVGKQGGGSAGSPRGTTWVQLPSAHKVSEHRNVDAVAKRVGRCHAMYCSDELSRRVHSVTGEFDALRHRQIPFAEHLVAPRRRVPTFHPDHVALESCMLRIMPEGSVERVQFNNRHTGQQSRANIPLMRSSENQAGLVSDRNRWTVAVR